MKFLKTWFTILNMDTVKEIRRSKVAMDGFVQIVATTEENDFVGHPLGAQCGETRVDADAYIKELMKLISKAPDYATIVTCNEKGLWELYIE